MSETLGAFLKRTREARRLSLRDVERITDGRVSNAYLSQVETGKVGAPSVLVLHRLSAAYAIDFAALCERACVGNPPVTPPPTCPTCGGPLWLAIEAALSHRETPGPSVGDGELIAAAEISRLRAALERFVKNEQSLAIDLMTAHRGRGNGVSSAMREDDADLRDELTVACAAIRDFLAHTALQPEQPALAKLDGATTTQTATATDGLCEDCPPVGYPTDKTRCTPCPRRTQTGVEHGVDTLAPLLSQAAAAGLYCTVGHTPASDVHRTPPAPERRYSAHVSGREGSTDAEAATLVDALRDALAAYGGAR